MTVVSIICFIGAICFAFLTQQATHNYRNSYGEDYEHQAIIYAVLAVILIVIGFILLFVSGTIKC